MHTSQGDCTEPGGWNLSKQIVEASTLIPEKETLNSPNTTSSPDPVRPYLNRHTIKCLSLVSTHIPYVTCVFSHF